MGCAGGIKSKYLIDRGVNVVGIDFSDKMIDIAKREVPSGIFIVKEMKDLGTLNYMFSGIFMQAVLLHIPKIKAKEMIQIATTKLKQGGLFI